jgi:undecaprenyl-diphosphatase
MTYITAAILGIIEGLTEFVPVSSSGHLIIARQLLGLQNATGLTFDAILQLGAILALGIYFWRDLFELAVNFLRIVSGRSVSTYHRTLLWAIVIGTIPGVIFGFLLEHKMETVFRNVALVAVTLILGSILMLVAERFAKGNKPLTLKNGLAIGFFQALALFPGVSRSGSTISGGLLLGLNRGEIIKFSFLLSFPIIVGSGLKKLYEAWHAHESGVIGGPLLVGFLCSFAFGLASIHFLIRYLKTHSMNVFAVYRIALALVILFFVVL